HELTHGFDSNGRLYDGDGNQKSWWTPSVSAEFDSRAQCLKDEYSTFVVNGENGSPLGNVNGNLTITENIADNGGVSLAYDAYQKYIKSPEAVVPPGTEVTEEEANQMFFLAFGQTFCGKARDGYMKNLLATNVHSPGQWRMNGIAMNNENFAKAFKCKAGAKMNPEKKCVLW
ncbi:Neprolysin cd1, peptidase family m13, neutral zinc metallopeptidase, partial [Globisporangium polare]